MKYFLLILLCFPLNAFAFNSAVIDAEIKTKMEYAKAEKQRLADIEEANKTPRERAQVKLIGLEQKFSDTFDNRKTLFEREINQTCKTYEAKVRERDQWIDVMNMNSRGVGQMRFDNQGVPAAVAATGYRTPFQIAQGSIQALEGQIDTMRRFAPAGLDLASCSGNFPYGGNIYILFSRGYVMETTEKSNMEIIVSKHNPRDMAFSVMLQSTDGKSDMTIMFENGKLIKVVGYNNQRFNINQSNGDYSFADGKIAIGANRLQSYIEQLYRDCALVDKAGACVDINTMFVLLAYNNNFIKLAIKTIEDNYILNKDTL